MAVSSSTSTINTAQKSFHITNPTPNFGCAFSNSIRFASKPRRFCIIRSSGDASAETVTTEADTGSSIEVPKEPPSLISALNVERALCGIPITDVDHYGRLGLQRGCSYDEVSVAYKAKLDKLMSQGLEEEELNKTLEPLKESYTILSTGDERRLYDWSLARSANPDGYIWPYEVEKTRPAEGTPPPVGGFSSSSVSVQVKHYKDLHEMETPRLQHQIIGFETLQPGRTRGSRADEVGGVLHIGMVDIVHRIIHRP